MRIAELSAYHVRIDLKKPVKHASYSRESNDTLIVCCRLDDGTKGWGEGLPRPYVTGETIETAFEQLRSSNLQKLLGSPFADLPAAIQLCETFQLNKPSEGVRDCFGNAARCAIEIAILDAATRVCNVPLSAVTNLVPETTGIRHSVDNVRYSGVITTLSPFQEKIRAWKIRLYGFQQCKVKVGAKDHDDVASFRRIRKIVKEKMDLRIDVNEAWTCENLEQKLAPLLPFQISSMEQPVPHEQVNGLSDIRKRIEPPIMLDESLCSIGDAHLAIEHGTCDLFNIRLSKCGGFINSLKLAATAHRAGLGYQLGCQVGETGILSAAGRHFATSVADIRFLEGSFDKHLVKERLTVEDMTFGYSGLAPALTGPGLGITLDSAALKRVTVAEDHWSFQ